MLMLPRLIASLTPIFFAGCVSIVDESTSPTHSYLLGDAFLIHPAILCIEPEGALRSPPNSLKGDYGQEPCPKSELLASFSAGHPIEIAAIMKVNVPGPKPVSRWLLTGQIDGLAFYYYYGHGPYKGDSPSNPQELVWSKSRLTCS